MSYISDYARELEAEIARLAKLAEVYRLSHHAQIQITKAAEARLEAVRAVLRNAEGDGRPGMVILAAQIDAALSAAPRRGDQTGCPPGCTSPFCDCPGTS